jgi:UDP-glucose 4-epimerase
MRVLVTGGAGFIGSHACVALAGAGHELTVLDNFANASRAVPDRLSGIIGRRLALAECDIRDCERVSRVLADSRADAVVHFAALKSVGESVANPLSYFDNNIGGTMSLLRAMRRQGVRDLIFSSSATVYGADARMPVDEDAALAPCNPYGRSKLVMEQLIGDICAAQPDFGAVVLRYFNPAGAHPSGMIGEDPRGTPDNLMPYVAQVAVGRRERLSVFGGDWPTRDGTGVRDYLHVMDLARAHVAALEVLARGRRGATTINLGTGRGTTVLELVSTFAQASGRPIPYEVVGRRPGDAAEMWAAPLRAGELLGWRAEHDLQRMCEDTWRWQSMNPQGYG